MCGTTGFLMKNVRYNWNPNEKCAVQLDFLWKVCATIGISKETYTTNRLWDVGPRRGRKKTYNPNAAGRGIRRKTYNPSRPGRKSEKKPTIQPVLLGCWLLVRRCRQPTQRPPVGAKITDFNKISTKHCKHLEIHQKMQNNAKICKF